jgi:predicted O-linked N-acetylglucosamine transferase (SPINDLY family)
VQTPEEYVQLAVALGTSEDRRRNMQRAIRDASPVLLEREAAARAVEDFLAQAAVERKEIP